ncbi:hypothetical protein NDU88_003231 [Pleurodeles waltl]|uniref:Uncharacterized protein n=1 Tax=Pleurodeles waltl TaxID=8319 RepID=A0AAV7NP51_PLEWA|nr:hypothetical protein NDU88_003231 [Pleurodeles waltl]
MVESQGRATALWSTGTADIHCKEDGAMAENREQGERRGTASKNKGPHQEEVEQATGGRADKTLASTIKNIGCDIPPAKPTVTWKELALAQEQGSQSDDG